jgi:peptidoglycan hydrolase-like protein with peptidoglycan-binding domain
MTPRLARIALCSFLVLAAGVAVNALFLQSRPTFATRAVVERPLPRTAPERNLPDKTGTAGEIEHSETIRALQRELRNLGYGALVSDGVMRPITRAAIMAYEWDEGLPLTGEASEMLLKRVLLGASATAEPSAAARKLSSARAMQVVRLVQEHLAALGYQTLKVDGRLGEDTLRAIRDFEKASGLPAKGRVSAELLMSLEAAAQAKRAAAR